jgi:hypothetical protein
MPLHTNYKSTFKPIMQEYLKVCTTLNKFEHVLYVYIKFKSRPTNLQSNILITTSNKQGFITEVAQFLFPYILPFTVALHSVWPAFLVGTKHYNTNVYHIGLQLFSIN